MIREVKRLDEESEEFKSIKAEWFGKAKDIKTVDELTDFIDHLLKDYSHDYGTVCHAITAMVLATAWMGSHIEGITGFQAGCVMWGFIRHWMFDNNTCGLKILDYDNMLYPQYADRFAKTIKEETFRKLQETAKQKLAEVGMAHSAVRSHWQSIVNGEVPFGYTIVKD
jgi:chemotaxis regulatin CheY-phosphate phosphatase CheZ